MELPKNTTQIGEMNKEHRIYIEDYVISYIKQLLKKRENKKTAVALYGRKTRGEEGTYYFLYGAMEVESILQFTKHLSAAQMQEMERARARYFGDLSLCGYCLLEGEELPEKIMILEQEICISVEGYARFYEKNDRMLEVLLNETPERETEDFSGKKYDRVRNRREGSLDTTDGESGVMQKGKKEIREEKKPTGYRMVRAASCILFAGAILGVTGHFAQKNGIEIEDKLIQAFSIFDGNTKAETEASKEERVQEKSSEENTREKAGVTNAGAIVTEDDLEQVLLEENRAFITDNTEEDNQSNQEDTGETVGTEQSLAEKEDTQVQEVLAQPENEEGTESGEEAKTVPTENTEAATSGTEIEQPAVEEQEKKAEPEYYEIQKGDTLISISMWRYGSMDHVSRICEVNSIKNPDNIQIGQKILLP